MHPNAEIEFRTAQSEEIFATLRQLEPVGSVLESEKEGTTPQLTAEIATSEILDRVADSIIDAAELSASIRQKGPFHNVFLQEIETANVLVFEIKRSLEELTLGFAGELTMTDQMEALMVALYLGEVPKTWSNLAWPSLRSLPSWLEDLTRRLNQLSEWAQNPQEIPRVTWISGLTNPSSFMTAIKQMYAEKTGSELDKLEIETEVTRKEVSECEQPSRDGFYVHGLYLQGARLEVSSFLSPARSKEMFFLMPVLNCKAVQRVKHESANIYQCPCYITAQRGSTYVFTAQLKTKAASARWVLAGVAAILDIGQ